jgi:hypothetical protein
MPKPAIAILLFCVLASLLTIVPVQAQTPGDFNLTPEMSVKLIVLDRFRSGDCRKNDRVNFKVDEDVMDGNGAVLIKKGTPAFGTVLNSRRAGAWGRRGALDVSVDYTTAVDGQKVDLRGCKDKRGGGSKSLMTAGALLVAWPLAFCKGSNVTIESGTTFMAYVDSNLRIAQPPPVSQSRAVAMTKASSQPEKIFTLQNGDRVSGRVLSLNNGQYLLATSMGQVTIAEEQVVRMETLASAGNSEVALHPASSTASVLDSRLEELRKQRNQKKAR